MKTLTCFLLSVCILSSCTIETQSIKEKAPDEIPPTPKAAVADTFTGYLGTGEWCSTLQRLDDPIVFTHLNNDSIALMLEQLQRQ